METNPTDIISREFPNEQFASMCEVLIGSLVYVFPYHHRLIYPISDERYWYVLDRGPILIDSKTGSYRVLSYSDFIQNHWAENANFFRKYLLFYDDALENLSVEFLIDLVKERRFLNMTDITMLGELYNIDWSGIRFNDEKKHSLAKTNNFQLYLDVTNSKDYEVFKVFLDRTDLDYEILKKGTFRIQRSLGTDRFHGSEFDIIMNYPRDFNPPE